MNLFTRALFCIGLVGASAATCAAAPVAPAVAWKSAFDRAEWMPTMAFAPDAWSPQAPDGSSPTPLEVDNPGFGVGMLVGDGNDANGESDHGLRVFKTVFGYYLAGYHTGASSAYYGFITAFQDSGALAAGFGTDGKLKAVVPFYPVDVANPLGTSKFYFTGAYRASPSADYDFGVYCLDGSTGGPCAGFGNTGVGLSVTPIDSNGFHNDFPVKIVTSGNVLYIAGTSASLAGIGDLDISVAAIDTAFGSPVAGFGNRPDAPGTVVYPFNYTPQGTDRTINLLARTGTGAGGHRIYVVGETSRNANGSDTDGFILALDSATGAKDTSYYGGGLRPLYADLGTTNKQDEIDAVAQTRDGDFVLAGTSRDDDGNQVLLLVKLDADGDYVPSFCGSGHCASARVLSTYEVPVGIAERTATRDLVVAMNIHDDFGTGADGHEFQGVLQLERNGNLVHAFQYMDYQGTTQPLGCAATDLVIDPTNRVMVAGTRTWDPATSDYDMTLTRMIDTDTIFANQFENVL